MVEAGQKALNNCHVVEVISTAIHNINFSMIYNYIKMISLKLFAALKLMILSALKQFKTMYMKGCVRRKRDVLKTVYSRI
jgi:hypothetical protein